MPWDYPVPASAVGAGLTAISPVYPTGVALDASGTTDMATFTNTTVTSATATWKNGQVIVIRGGNAAGATYVGTIVAGGGTTSVTVSPATTATGSGLTGFFGTDDTVAWQTALRAASLATLANGVSGSSVDAGPYWRSLIRQRNDPTCGTTQNLALVTDAAIVAGDVGKLVCGAGIPAGSFVGTVTPGVSFTLVGTGGTAVLATASASVTLCIGGLFVPTGTRLLNTDRGPWYPNSNPVLNIWGPTFVCVQSASINGLGYNSGNPLIGLAGNAKFGDAIFYSANQLVRTAASPTQFAPAIGIVGTVTSGCVIDCPMLCNMDVGLDLQGGEHLVRHVRLGCMDHAIQIDHQTDFIRIEDVMVVPYWDICEGAGVTLVAGTFSAYALTNGIGMLIGRADSLHVGFLGTFQIEIGFQFHDSSDAGQVGGTCGYGAFDQVDVDTCAYGCVVQAANTPGVQVNQFIAGANGTGVGTAGQTAVLTQTGGSVAAKIKVASWAIRGAWGSGNSVTGAGCTVIVPGTAFG